MDNDAILEGTRYVQQNREGNKGSHETLYGVSRKECTDDKVTTETKKVLEAKKCTSKKDVNKVGKEKIEGTELKKTV